MLLSRIGPIALEEPLGGSPDSNVLRGVHLERNKALAVKLLPRSLVDRPMAGDAFADDVKRLTQLVHPHIARVLGGAMDNGQPYLAMELVRGESLRSLLDRRGRLPWETMADLAEQICEALVYAHEHGVVHRRLTPDRVLIAEDGGVKLVGFDCALADASEIISLRAPMSVTHYLAPQEIRGKSSTGLPSNDLFSLGVMLYEGLAGEPPWPARTPTELVLARQAAPAPRASAKVLDCPVWLDVLVARLLEVKREGRLATADEARRAILNARSKATARTGALQHAWSGKQGALATNVDKRELNRLRRAAAPKEKDTSPFYERAWFLAACLAAVVAIGAWVMWPQSEEELIAQIQPLIASESVSDWRRARDGIEDLLERFPDTAYRQEIEEFQFRYAVHDAEARIENIDRFDRSPEYEADRQFHAARRDEKSGDRLSAWQRYEAVIRLFAGSEHLEERAVVELARRRIAAIRAAARDEQNAGQQRAFVQEKLKFADSLAASGDVLRAREVLESIVEIYDGNRELASLVAEARERIRRLHQGANAD